MPHALRVALLVCLCLPAPAGATTFAFSGTIVDAVVDTGDFLDASVDIGTVVTGTYEVTVSGTGSSPFNVGVAHLSFQLGNYLFDQSQSSHTIALIDDHVLATDPFLVMDDIWEPAEMVDSELTPASNSSGDFGGYAALIQFFDFDSTAFDGNETEPFVPDSTAAPWDQARLTLNSVDGSLVYDNGVKVQAEITSWSVQPVPEPCTSLLLVLGLASFAHQRRRARGR